MKTDAQRLGNGKKAFNVKQIEEKIANLPSTEDIEEMLETKQDVLTAGENITIENNVISATGGGSSDEWEIIPTTDYENYFDELLVNNGYNKPKEDLLVIIKTATGSGYYTLDEYKLLKGQNISYVYVSPAYYYTFSGEQGITAVNIQIGRLLRSKSMNVSKHYIDITASNGILNINTGSFGDLYDCKSTIEELNQNVGGVFLLRRKTNE